MDVTKNWKLASERLATETDPRRRQVLEVIIEHGKAEAAADLDRLMATVAGDPEYHFWGPTGDTGPKGRDNLLAYYGGLLRGDCHRIEFDVDRLYLDDAGAFTEGWLRIAWPGHVLQSMGQGAGVVDDPAAYYLYEARNAIIWVIDADGKVVGEDSYNDGRGFDNLRKLGADELPDPYLADA